MDAVIFLIPYLVIAAAIHWFLNLRGMGPLRRAMDVLTNRQITDLGKAKRFATIGEAVPFEAQGVAVRHDSTVGLRILSTFLTVILLCMFGFAGPSTPMLGQGLTPFLTFCLLVLIAGYYLIFIWTYRVTVEAGTLSLPTYHMTQRHHDLTRLTRIEDDGAYMLRLYFQDGSRAEVLKYVTGRKTLLTRLERAVKQNTLG